MDLVGRRLANRFVIERRLGEGGMGIVYEARDEERDEVVALKTIGSVGAANGAAVYGLKKEFRALADLNHPRLVRLHELFSDDDLWFFTMARVTGLPFDAHVRKEELSAAEEPVSPIAQTFSPWSADRETLVRRAFAQLIEGVRAIHGAGKMHLDLKPSNVLVDPSGNVVILDFGLVQSTLPGLVTRDGVAGTPGYMAPEQLREGGACAASDWYAVGTMLFEVLTGRLPFGTELTAILVAKTNGKLAPSARTLSPGAPADLAALAADLLRPQLEDRPNAEEIAARIGHAAPSSSPSLRPHAPFVGRDAELARLRALFEEARTIGTRGAYLSGLSGMGKTTLVERFLEEVRHDAVVLVGRCYERESVPFKALDPIIDALSRHLTALPPVAAARVTPRDTPELCRLFPVLARVGVLADVMNARPVTPDPQELRRRGFGALSELFSRLADARPLVVALDDLQWGDLDSGVFFAQLLASEDPPKLLFIGSYRSDEIGRSPLLRGIVGHKKREAGERVQILELGALSDDESRELATLLMPDRAALVSTIASEAGGSPLFIGELARSKGAAATSLSAAIAARVEELPDSARRLLEVVAVAGRPIAQRVALRAAELTASNDAITILRAAQLLRSSGAHLDKAVETYHDRIRESVVAALSQKRRTAHHVALAKVYAAEPEPPIEALAHHYREAGDRPHAFEYAVKAAERAASVFAFERAATFYRDALTDGPNGELQTKLADALASAGHALEAADAYLAAAGESNVEQRIDLERRATYEILRVGHVERGRRHMRELFAELGLWLPARVSFAHAIGLALSFWYAWRGVEWPVEDRPLDPATRARIDVGQSMASALALVEMQLAGFFAAMALRRAIAAGDRRRIAIGLFQVSWYVGSLRPASSPRLEEWRRYQKELAQTLRDPRFEADAALSLAANAYSWGRWREALEAATTAEAIYERCTGVGSELHYARVFALRCLFFLGENKAEHALFQKLSESARDTANVFSRALLVLSFAHTRLHADDAESALAETESALEGWPGKRFEFPHTNNLAARTFALLYLGRAKQASAEIEQRWVDVEGSGLLTLPFGRAFLFTLRGLAAVAAGDRSAARRSADVVRASGVAGFLGFAELLEASASDDRALARDLLARARATFDEHGMKEWSRVVRARLGESVAEELRAEGVVNPARLVAALAPGFD